MRNGRRCGGTSAYSRRDWEQGRFSPDPTVRAYLTIIDRDPEAVEKALTRKPAAA
jgi:putative transcriptional regulator